MLFSHLPVKNHAFPLVLCRVCDAWDEASYLTRVFIIPSHSKSIWPSLVCNIRGLALLSREVDDEPCRGTKDTCFRTAYPQENLRPSEDGRRMANHIQQWVVPTIRWIKSRQLYYDWKVWRVNNVECGRQKNSETPTQSQVADDAFIPRKCLVENLTTGGLVNWPAFDPPTTEPDERLSSRYLGSTKRAHL